jgi:hypothetical protein
MHHGDVDARFVRAACLHSVGHEPVTIGQVLGENAVPERIFEHLLPREC